jgi:hypothetical protein
MTYLVTISLTEPFTRAIGCAVIDASSADEAERRVYAQQLEELTCAFRCDAEEIAPGIVVSAVPLYKLLATEGVSWIDGSDEADEAALMPVLTEP